MANVGDGAGGVTMATVAPKIRLVQCPRCREVLTELSNVPVYQCGGCGIHLQAKPWALTSSASNLSASSDLRNLNRSIKSGNVSERDDNSSSSSSSSADSSAFSESGKSLVHLPNDAQLAGDDDQKSEACNQETQGEIKAANGYTSGEIDDCKFSNQQQPPGCCTDKQQEVTKEASLSTQAIFLEKEGTSPDVGVASQAESNGDRPLGGRGRLERDELQPQPRSCVNGYASGISFDQSQRGMHRNSNFHPRINTADIERQKIRLLKLVQELRDQLTGSCSLDDKVGGRVSAEDTRRDQHAPRFLYGEALEKSKYRIDPRSPVAGGASSLACPRCSKQLQLPADFLISRRIRCGACSEILKLSLVNSTRLDPSATILDSHLADVVSCSESYSTEADHAPSSSGSFKHRVRRKRIISDKLKSSGKQPLHRLMGYSSLSGAQYRGTLSDHHETTASFLHVHLHGN